MSRIRVRVCAYILTLYPESITGTPLATARQGGARLRSLDMGLALPSFWTRGEITAAFAEANRIWTREADIEFSPVTISRRDESVPADESSLWIRFVNDLPPHGRGIGVGFVNDLPSQEGGWGGGRVAVISGRNARSGLPGFAGNLLAHELGHVLIDDPNHGLARSEPSNLMFDRRNPRVANAGLLNDRQRQSARRRAQAL